jgi:hypothetical protein
MVVFGVGYMCSGWILVGVWLSKIRDWLMIVGFWRLDCIMWLEYVGCVLWL